MPQIIRRLKDQQQNIQSYALSALNEMAKHDQYSTRVIADIPNLSHILGYLSPDFTDIRIQVHTNLFARFIHKPFSHHQYFSALARLQNF